MKTSSIPLYKMHLHQFGNTVHFKRVFSRSRALFAHLFSVGNFCSSSPPPQLGKFLFKWSIFPSSFLKGSIVSHIHSDFQGDLKRLTASTLTMKTRIYEDTKGEPFQRDLPKCASGNYAFCSISFTYPPCLVSK